MSREINLDNITDASSGAAFTVKVVTRADNAEFAGVEDDGSLRIRLTAQASDTPECNEELIDFLAKMLDAKKSQFELIAGESKRTKLVGIEGVPADLLEERFSDR